VNAPDRAARLRAVAIAAGAAFLVAAIAVSLFLFIARKPCGNEILSRSTSPDGALDAIVFRRSCGAATPFFTEVSVLRAGEPLRNEAGNLVGADTDRGRAPAGPAGGPELRVRWSGPRELEVSHHRKARVLRDANTDVIVRFVAFD
jgi:hypothetical protein